MRASGASELRNFSHFHILNLLFPSIFCWYFRYFVSETFNFRCQHSPYIYNQCSFLLLLTVWCYYIINDSIYRQNTNIYTNVCVCERAERASLEYFGIFTFLNCYFFQYFVGTSDTLSVQMTCLSAYMYRQISQCTVKCPNVPTKVRKGIIGGGGAIAPLPPPLPPSGYANGSDGLINSQEYKRFESYAVTIKISMTE